SPRAHSRRGPGRSSLSHRGGRRGPDRHRAHRNPRGGHHRAHRGPFLSVPPPPPHLTALKPPAPPLPVRWAPSPGPPAGSSSRPSSANCWCTRGRSTPTTWPETRDSGRPGRMGDTEAGPSSTPFDPGRSMFRHEFAFTTHGQCSALMEVIRSGRAHLPQFGRSESYPAGHVVYDYGDAVEHLYLVEEGMVRTSVLSPGGRELVTGIWGAGDLFGQFCLCRQGERNERATVIQDAKIVRMGVEELLELAATGDGALAMLQLFCQRISVLEQQVA